MVPASFRSKLGAHFLRYLTLVTVCVVLAIVLLVREPASGVVPAYRFTDYSLEIETDPALASRGPQLLVGYDISWSDQTYPGIRSCSLIVSGPDGLLITRKDLNVSDTTPEPTRVYTHVPVTDPTQLAVAAAVAVECTNERLDNPEGRYVLSNVAADRAPQFPGDSRTFVLSYHDEWIGGGIPGAAVCLATAKDVAGTTLFTYEFTLQDLRGGGEAVTPIFLDVDIVEEPIGAELICTTTR